MAKKNQRNRGIFKSGGWIDFRSQLSAATKQSVLAILALASALFFALAALGYAGLVGDSVANLLRKFFGWTFFFSAPVILLLLALALGQKAKVWLPSLLASALVLFITLLASLGIILEASASGLLGQWLARAFSKIFGFYALIFLAALGLIAIIVLLDHGGLAPKLQSVLGRLRNKFQNQNSEAEIITEPTVTVTEPKKEEASPAAPKINQRAASPSPFKPPPLSLLATDSGKPAGGDLKANANIIKRTLANFGILVEMDEVSVGPSITRYAFKPAEGVKLSRIVTLQNDLSLALAAHPLRIEAPIPGKSLVGIEIPNTVKSIVGLASLIGSQEFAQSDSPLLVSLGRDITGHAHFASIAKAPHLLIAGATGSGKSVVIHTFITSLLYKNSPENLRFIMIDPKRVELTLYNQIPHLLNPVLTDPKKAIAALRWAAKEMERRYLLLEEMAVRDVGSYHQLATKESADFSEPMPYIVIVIDELADMMSTYPRELEAVIVRLAQMSRAVGIHLVLSTQRPSVEVITGLIKANIPTRIALQVASQIDSRTILDSAGAEKLLGAGDMLYLAGDRAKPIRLQSAFVSESEAKKVVQFLKEQNSAAPEEILALAEERPVNPLDESDETGDDEELYEEARELVIRAGKASASYLQRKLKIGYARAARLLDLLEEHQVIGPGQGAKIREVYERDPLTPTTE